MQLLVQDFCYCTSIFSFLAHCDDVVAFAAISSASMVKLRLQQPSINPLSDDRQSDSSNFKDHVVVSVVMLLKRWPLKAAWWWLFADRTNTLVPVAAAAQPSSSGKGSRPTDIRALLCRRTAMVLGLLLLLVVLDDSLCSGCFRVVMFWFVRRSFDDVEVVLLDNASDLGSNNICVLGCTLLYWYVFIISTYL